MPPSVILAAETPRRRVPADVCHAGAHTLAIQLSGLEMGIVVVVVEIQPLNVEASESKQRACDHALCS